MAIKSRRNFMSVYGAADLELEAKKGQSLLVKNVMIYEPTAVYAVFKTGTTTVGCFRVHSLLGNHLQIPYGRAYNAENITQGASVGSETILQYLMRKGIFTGYPVASGETFLISLVTGATAMKIVEYDIYDEDDMKDDMENGSKSKVSTYLSYGDTGAEILLQVDEVLDESNNPPEFPDFPFGEKVPDDRQIEMHGIIASDVSPALNIAANFTSTRYLKMMRGIEFLFDKELKGIPYYSNYKDALGAADMIAEGYAAGGNYTEVDRREPLMFDPPVVVPVLKTA